MNISIFEYIHFMNISINEHIHLGIYPSMNISIYEIIHLWIYPSLNTVIYEHILLRIYPYFNTAMGLRMSSIMSVERSNPASFQRIFSSKCWICWATSNMFEFSVRQFSQGFCTIKWYFVRKSPWPVSESDQPPMHGWDWSMCAAFGWGLTRAMGVSRGNFDR